MGAFIVCKLHSPMPIKMEKTDNFPGRNELKTAPGYTNLLSPGEHSSHFSANAEDVGVEVMSSR